jgi:hypothetical protein
MVEGLSVLGCSPIELIIAFSLLVMADEKGTGDKKQATSPPQSRPVHIAQPTVESWL